MQQYMTGEQVARVVTLPVNGWVNYDEDYIQGEFDFEVRGGSTEPRNESFRRQSALQLADISFPFVEMGVADPVALYQKMLRDGFGEKDAQRFIAKPEEQAPPDQQQGPPQGPPPEQQMPMDPSMMGGPPPMDPNMMPPMDPTRSDGSGDDGRRRAGDDAAGGSVDGPASAGSHPRDPRGDAVDGEGPRTRSGATSRDDGRRSTDDVRRDT